MTSSLALFVALSGGAYAAVILPANSVGPRQLKSNAVERAKIKNQAVNSAKVRDGSITGADVDEASLGTVAYAASAGFAGRAGSAVALDKVTYKTVVGTIPEAQMGGGSAATAVCDAGQHVIGGGVHVPDPASSTVDDSYPDAGGTAWSVHIRSTPGPIRNFTVYAICTSVTAVG